MKIFPIILDDRKFFDKFRSNRKLQNFRFPFNRKQANFRIPSNRKQRNCFLLDGKNCRHLEHFGYFVQLIKFPINYNKADSAHYLAIELRRTHFTFMAVAK